MKNKKSLGIFAAALLILAAALIPLPDGLTRPGMMALALFLSAVILWLAESFPMSVTGLTVTMLMVLFRIFSLNEAFDFFADTAFFFIFGTYAIKACLSETTIPDRICAFFIRLARGNAVLFVLGILLSSACISAIMSNMATCALFSTLALKLLKINGSSEDSRLAKCLMIGIPFACGAGGFATPAGTPANMIAVNLLEENVGVTIRFLDWTLVGVPLALLSVLVICAVLCLTFRPEPLSEQTVRYAGELSSSLGKLNLRERKTVAIIGLEIALWLAGTWIPALNTTLVALLCMALMFLPGIDILNWKTYDRHANYDALFMVGSVTALVGGLTVSGATAWLVRAALPDTSGMPVTAVYLVCSLIAAVLHMLIPSGSPALTLAAVPLLGIAAASPAVNGAALMLMAGFWAGATYLLPFDGVNLLTYSTGLYKIKDMSRAGVFLYIIMVPVSALLIPALCGIVHLG